MCTESSLRMVAIINCHGSYGSQLALDRVRVIIMVVSQFLDDLYNSINDQWQVTVDSQFPYW